MQAIKNLTANNITELLAHATDGTFVTMYIPTHRQASPPQITEDQIRTKNLFHKAIEILQTRHETSFAEFMTQTLQRLLDDKAFWEHQTEGLLLCARNKNVELYHLPLDTEVYMAVDDSFHLAPIFGLLHDAKTYYILALGQHKPKLFEGDMYGVRPSELTLPQSVEAALNLDETSQKSEQQRSAEGSNGNGGSYNGRGSTKNPAEADRQRFWRYLDQEVRHYCDTTCPLILAGVEADEAEFRAVSRYPRILEQAISGNQTNVRLQDLFKAASEIMQAELMALDHQKAVDRYSQLHGENPEQAADNVGEIAGAAAAGRVETLLIGTVRNTADTVRDGNASLPVLSFSADDELNRTLHEVAQAVWQTSGTIINLEQANKPLLRTSMVAALRY